MTEWQSQVAENARRYQELRQRLSRMSITEASRDGSVRVSISPDGLLTDLKLFEHGHPMPLADVAAQVMNCVRRAQSRIPDMLTQAIADSVGTDDPSGHLIVADARQRFPQPPPEKPGHQPWQPTEIRVAPAENPPTRPASRPRPAQALDDDWDDQRPIMEDI